MKDVVNMNEKVINEIILQIYDTNLNEKVYLSELISKTHYKVNIKDMPQIFSDVIKECERKNIKLDFYDTDMSKAKYAQPFKRI